MRMSDWSSDVCSSDLAVYGRVGVELCYQREEFSLGAIRTVAMLERSHPDLAALLDLPAHIDVACRIVADQHRRQCRRGPVGLREIQIGRASGRERVCLCV